MRGDRTVCRQIGIGNVTAREQETAVFTVGREFRRAQVVHRAFATLQPFRIVGRDDCGIHFIHLLDKIAQLIDKRFDVHQAFKVQRTDAVEIDRVRHPTDRQVLDMRRFTAQQRHHAVSVTLTFQRLQIVSDRNQVDLRR
ncbi:Uncharacterised protein [Salmonella enterica subsp. enterica serovar Bovismorbificans]|nr:Uncharacterised protein [Salmonella enterica subsp. enterica serovar Bovismorbificans]CNU13185.1 Uncharacterised protein [Salmonella enterica subsp. enterica serovar Bovismorbificans]